jgi:ubiquitin carboxyl-terminal hydrolase 48
LQLIVSPPFLAVIVVVCSFDLQAVLVHRGPSAQSGHYVVHVLDLPTATWFEFDDNECKIIEADKSGRLPLGEPLYDPYRSGSQLSESYHC